MVLQKAMVSSKSNEWATPQDLFDKLNEEYHFTLDPASTDENAKCEKHFTKKDNGLSKDWSKDIVFLNPPYGRHTRKWMKKALDESRKGAIVVCLIAVGMDRSYWHDYILPYASQIRFLRGRLKFGEVKTTAPFASAIVIFNKKDRGQKIAYYTERNGSPKLCKNQTILKNYLGTT